MKTTLLGLALLLFCSCNDSLHGKYVKDSDNNIYRLDWRIGGLYALEEVKKEHINQVESLKTK